MTTLLDDNDVASIQLRDPTPNTWIVTADGPESAKIVRTFLESTTWSDLENFADGLRDRSSGDGELHGFGYLPHQDSPELPVDRPCVRIDVYKEAVYLSIRAFETLMMRFLREVIMRANKEKNAVLKEDWWPNLLAAANDLETRTR